MAIITSLEVALGAKVFLVADVVAEARTAGVDITAQAGEGMKEGVEAGVDVSVS